MCLVLSVLQYDNSKGSMHCCWVYLNPREDALKRVSLYQMATYIKFHHMLVVVHVIELSCVFAENGVMIVCHQIHDKSAMYPEKIIRGSSYDNG